jgi:hypothetical protein
MNIKNTWVVALSAASLQICPHANAQGRKAEHAETHAARANNMPARQAPGPFQAHPAGTHPHGPIVRAHATRILSPKVVKYGSHQWNHWGHAEFARPVYYWNWSVIRSVSCVAEDTYGDQYPVTEEVSSGFGLANMTAVEDDALDRCYSESGGDQTCYLATCSHF